VLTVAWVISKLQRDVPSGMRLIFALLVFLPTSVRIALPTGLPQLTIHRILIVVAFLFLIQNRSPDRTRWPIPNIGFVILFGLSQVISLLLGTQFVPGLKGCFDYGIEVVLFYILISEYVQTESDIVQLLASICYGLAAVAVVATIDKYWNVDLVETIVPFRGLPDIEEGIASTYPHRILLGYAMAMGVPLSLALPTYFNEVRRKRVMYGIALLLIAATYFSMSRGPWLGLGLGLLGIAIVGGRKARKSVALIALLIAIVLILRPGVRDTISNMYSETFEEDSAKGNSYQTRWQLWTIAWTEIKVSPGRLLFGFGPVSTESMDLSHYWFGTEGWSSSVTKIGHTSWDNNYASDLIELGVVGFLLEAVLFAFIIKTLVTNWRRSDPNDRILQGGVTIACLVFMFAMTNVFIFSPQLKYLFWTLVAVGCNFSRIHAIQASLRPMEDRFGDADAEEGKLVEVPDLV
jgi:O-antigen ligase/polysaccharide polymerase Wzy-like membrane protein